MTINILYTNMFFLIFKYVYFYCSWIFALFLRFPLHIFELLYMLHYLVGESLFKGTICKFKSCCEGIGDKRVDICLADLFH